MTCLALWLTWYLVLFTPQPVLLGAYPTQAACLAVAGGIEPGYTLDGSLAVRAR